MKKIGNLVELVTSFASGRTYKNMAITFLWSCVVFFSFYQLALIDSWSIRPVFLWLAIASLIATALAGIGLIICHLSDNSSEETTEKEIQTMV